MTNIFENLKAVARAQMKQAQSPPPMIWPPVGAKQCKWCGDVIDAGEYCDVACQHDMMEDQTFKHCEAPDMLDTDTMEMLAEEQDKFHNIHS